MTTLLSKVARNKPFLGVSLSEPEDAEPVEVAEDLEECDPLPWFSYLDSSSRVISVRGANVYMASLYANLEGVHLTVPVDTSYPFLAIKGSGEVISEVESSPLSRFVRTKNVNGVPYDAGYKDDNILDELRISLENVAISKSRRAIIDGPVFPGPYLPVVGEPYRSAYESLIRERRTENLVGIVKRLNMSRKLQRSELWKGEKGFTDDVVTLELGRGRERYVTPVLREDFHLSSSTLTRYMVYVKVRDSVFRVESVSQDLLCSGVSTAIRHASYRGIPDFIEVADSISRKLGASVYLLSFIHAHSKLGVTYDEWNRLKLATLDLEVTSS